MSDTKEEAETQPGLQWNESVDTMLAAWCDEAKCFEWMNTESYSRYNKLATGMTIATNTIIAVSGIANIIIGKVPGGNIDPSTIFGCISIFIGLVNMLQDKFDWLTMANNFKQSAVHWAVISRKIEEQLAIPHSGRKDCGTFLKYIKQDISLVSERNTSIPKDIRDLCFKKFSAIPNFNIPDLCGQLEHTSVYVEALKVPLLENPKPS